MTHTWSVWSITWLSLVAVAAASVLVLAGLSLRGATTALQSSLEDHLTAQAGLVAAAVSDLPIETVARVGGTRSLASIDARVAALAQGGGLSDVALCGPDGQFLGSQGDWLAGAAEADLIALARGGVPTTGPLYSSVDGELFMTAYRSLPGHPGWVVAVEGSGATLGAADDLYRAQLTVGVFVVGVVAVLAGLVAAALAAPLARLDRQLSELRPGDAPGSIAPSGPREVRRVAGAVVTLLQGIRTRDLAIDEAHEARLSEVSRLAAGVAHEIRNPLNAMSITAQRLARPQAEREALSVRLLDQVGQLEVIVQRLVDLTAPIDPADEPVDLAQLWRGVADASPLAVQITGSGPAVGDRGMVIQVLRNLLLNAEHAGAKGVRVALSPRAGGLSCLVSDDGAGIPDGSEEALFTWFHTTRAQGTGLGLPQSRRLVEAMGGHLELVEARPATFRLWMPSP